MTAIITRKGIEHWRRMLKDAPTDPLPADLAYIVSDYKGRRSVTWAEVLERRREHQRLLLACKQGVEVVPWRALRLSVSYFDMDLMGGWQAFLDGHSGNRWAHRWIDRDARHLRETLMRLYPVLLSGSSWDDWKPAFARQFRRRTQGRRPLGVAYLWERHGQLALCPEGAVPA